MNRPPSAVRAVLALLSIFLCFSLIPVARAQYLTSASIKIEKPLVAIADAEFDLEGKLHWSGNVTDNQSTVTYKVLDGDSQLATGDFAKLGDSDGGETAYKSSVSFGPVKLGGSGYRTLKVVLESGNSTNFLGETTYTLLVIPGVVTIIPIILTLLLAFWTRQVLLALWCGVFASASIIQGGNLFQGFLRSVDTYMVRALADKDHIKVVLFTWFLSALIALVIKSGGAQGLATQIGKYVRTRWSGQWATLALGIIIFFDDYASALIVGNNMRLVTDTVFMSHEKLAFIVHATSAGPASVAPMSSWIGFELGLIKDNLPATLKDQDPFNIFLKTIPTRFYPLLMLTFVAAITFFKRDFGPMFHAERRAYKYNKLVEDGDSLDDEDVEKEMQPVPDQPQRWWNAFAPIFVMLACTIIGLFVSGYYAVLAGTPEGEYPDLSAANIAGSGASYDSLVWGSFFGCIFAIIIYLIQRLMGFRLIMGTIIHGIKGITEPLLTLTLAWAIGQAFTDLQVAKYIVGGLGNSISPGGLPALTFLVSCLISFATGTSWGTMSIVFPLALPLADSIASGSERIIYETISAILTGSIFGDQCSPISDTSILSAIASAVSVQRHVETQLPYAVVTALVSLIVAVPAGYGVWPGFVSLILGIVAIVGVVWALGTKVEGDDRSKFWWIERWVGPRRKKGEVKGDLEEVEEAMEEWDEKDK
ncbi:hypothetical protein HK102_001138 [Quaeritorhiza haematococci]|nr:hypothetical protein HK102_001138 [Quaeritorhiza haematococci]